MPSVTVRGLAWACSEAPASSCTCRGCFCSNAGRGGRAEPRPLLRNPAGGRVGCCGASVGGMKVKAEAGALSSVTDSSLRLPVHRWKGPGDCAGQRTGKRRDSPCSEDTPPPAPTPRFPWHGLQPHSPFAPLSDHNRSQEFNWSSLCREIPPLPPPPPMSSRWEPSISPFGAPVRFTASNSSLILRGYPRPAPFGPLRKPGWVDRPGARFRAPQAGPCTLAARVAAPDCEVRNGRKLQPVSGRGRGDLGGFKRRWRDTRATVGTTFRRRSRVLLVGELSKFPFPCDSSRGKCFFSFTRGAPALCGQRDPRASGVLAEEQAQVSLPPERCRGWRLGSWLHKHPHPSTCPRLPARWPPPLILADHRARVPKLVPYLACYPQKKLQSRDLPLLALSRLTLRVPNRGRRGWARGSGATPSIVSCPLGRNLVVLCYAGQKGISCSSPRLEFTDVATNFQSLHLSW
ncbi:PREDICTED: LOW QUALITY PROTEIN: killin [Ceratotherium simum simum]|uniref:LOW QUALITY PROTEIN: killin n=1 Tax=Ceratotherium simum simum TaxID=73337 RepID=A0ABM1DF93_CERSS|nr:PREDICTED: LOW QUALITY PROTEIN: killin [Ceratotherium simum simum]